MIVMTKKINRFTALDDKGPVAGNYYINQNGELVSFSTRTKPKKEIIPYAVSVNVDDMDDVVTMHVSEIEDMITKLKNNLPNVTNHDLQMKYQGYLEALNYVISHNSYIDPWQDFIDDIEEELIWNFE